MQTMNHQDDFCDVEFFHRNDGLYSKGSNYAGFSVRPLYIKRKCSLYFGSYECVEMSAAYHIVSSMLKLCGK